MLDRNLAFEDVDADRVVFIDCDSDGRGLTSRYDSTRRENALLRLTDGRLQMDSNAATDYIQQIAHGGRVLTENQTRICENFKGASTGDNKPGVTVGAGRDELLNSDLFTAAQRPSLSIAEAGNLAGGFDHMGLIRPHHTEIDRTVLMALRRACGQQNTHEAECAQATFQALPFFHMGRDNQDDGGMDCERDAPLTCQREMFSLPDGDCYLNSAYMGPLPVCVQQAGVEALATRSFPANIKPIDFFEPAERTRKLCAQLVNANAERVAFVTSVSYGMATIAKNLRVRPGQNVVLLGDQFPSNVYPWRDWRAGGVQIHMIDAPDAPWLSARRGASRAARWNAAVIEAIDSDTALVSVEQAHWTDGTLFDLACIGETCRKTGAAFVIDGTQTVGAMPLDMAQIRPDALVVHSYKAMLCNYGLGFMVLGERFASGCPLEQSWLMRAGSENFSGLVEYEDRYVEGMRRFDTSLRANPVLIRMLEAAAALLLQWRPESVRRYLLGIERDFVVRVREMGFEVADESERAANLFGLKAPPGFDVESCLEQLAQRHIHVSLRGSTLRVSPHVYNDETDLERLAQALEAVRPR